MKKTLFFLLILSSLWIGSCSEDSQKPCTKPVVSAGEDQTFVDETTATLHGTTSDGTGTWTITSGDGGEIVAGDPASLKGELKNTYKLKWEAENNCGKSSDEVSITFNPSCGDTETIDDFVANIHWIQQACFKIEAKPFTIYIDPNSITQKDTADIILITHPHADHYTVPDLDKISSSRTIIIAPAEVNYDGPHAERIVLQPGKTYNAFDCISIKAVPAYNIKKNYHPESSNWVGYVINVNGVTLYHSGDTERIPEMKDITCDIAMLPLGQTYTFDTVDEAAEAAKDVHAKLAIPMHFGLYEGTDKDAQTFKTLLDGIIPVVIKERGQ
jgi:L-ascorbate metabolism protein UlaG (beta-lactamase superfamily)